MTESDRALELLHHNAQAVADTFPAARAVLVSVVWDAALEQEPPHGLLVFQKNTPITPETVIAALSQNNKMAAALLRNFNAWASANAAASATSDQKGEKP